MRTILSEFVIGILHSLLPVGRYVGREFRCRGGGDKFGLQFVKFIPILRSYTRTSPKPRIMAIPSSVSKSYTECLSFDIFCKDQSIIFPASISICGSADRLGKGKRCCCCCGGGGGVHVCGGVGGWGGFDHFSFSHVQFFGGEKEKNVSEGKGKTLSQEGCEESKTGCIILH